MAILDLYREGCRKRELDRRETLTKDEESFRKERQTFEYWFNWFNINDKDEILDIIWNIAHDGANPLEKHWEFQLIYNKLYLQYIKEISKYKGE